MRRRELITLLGGAAMAWPLGTRAEQASNKRPLVGFLGGANRETGQPSIEPWLEAMRELGHVPGQSIDIEYRFAEGDFGRLPGLARQLVELKPDVILAAVTPCAAAAHEASPSIPIVCPSLSDTNRYGLATNDARPDQNVTGVRSWVDGLATKQVELAREIVPGATRIGLLINATTISSSLIDEVKAAGPRTGISFVSREVRSAEDFETAFQRFASEGATAVVVIADSLFFSERQRIARLAIAARLPAVYSLREHVIDGGLASYGVDYRDSFRRAAVFIDKILKGARPRDLPIEFPTKLVLAINLRAAKALGLDISPTLLARADEVVE